MTDTLAIYGQFDQMQRAASALYKSGYFRDAASEAQAIVKVMAGAELGLPPFASMSGINIIQGKPTLGANVIATLVKNDHRYDYRVKVCDNTTCILAWFENGQPTGESSFTMKEAQDAGLTGKDNWKKYPSDMLFARAISRGARRFAPGIFGGSPVYTADEMGQDVDPEGYVEAVITEAAPRPAEVIVTELGYEAKNDNGAKPDARPYKPAVLYERIQARAKYHKDEEEPVTDQFRHIIAAALDAIFDGEKTKRYKLCKWLTGEASTKNIPDNYMYALQDWLIVTAFDQPPTKHAIAEAKSALAEVLKAAGQQELL